MIFPRLYDHKAYKLLEKCSDANDMTEWNDYRIKTDNSFINFRFADFRDFYLAKANLSNVDFRFANLEGSNFDGANVANARLGYWKILILFDFIFFFSIQFVFDYFGLSDSYQPYLWLMLRLIVSKFPAIQKLTSVIAIIFLYFSFNFLEINGMPIVMSLGGLLIMIADYGVPLYFNPMAIAKADNPEECIGFNLKQFVTTNPDMLGEELIRLKKKVDAINDEFEKESIAQRMDANEHKLKLLERTLSNKKHLNQKANELFQELEKPYKYLSEHINAQIVLMIIYFPVLFGVIFTFINYAKLLYIERDLSFKGLFIQNGASIPLVAPEFGTIFGIILYYGVPVIVGIGVVVYLFAKINQSIDKITEHRASEQKIKEVVSILKAKIVVGLTEDEFDTEAKLLLKIIENNIFKDNKCDSKISSGEPILNFFGLSNDIKEVIKEQLKGKDK